MNDLNELNLKIKFAINYLTNLQRTEDAEELLQKGIQSSERILKNCIQHSQTQHKTSLIPRTLDNTKNRGNN